MLTYKFIKQLLDRLTALILLILVVPILMVVTILIYFEMGNPTFFKQPRPGKDGHIFNFYKFRTMSNATDINGDLLSDAQRLTALGQFLRKTSLDELPQLVNVLKGDMSFVGPRPLLVEYLDRYTPEQFRRHEVQPGITGWAQVNGRNSLSWEEKFRLDVWYVEHSTLLLDLKIVLLTILKVMKSEGISHSNHVTMEKFQGTSQPMK
jgi:lipopolysaccharide/colanic/teichoic acid biosynthesis glycosyltransferase